MYECMYINIYICMYVRVDKIMYEITSAICLKFIAGNDSNSKIIGICKNSNNINDSSPNIVAA